MKKIHGNILMIFVLATIFVWSLGAETTGLSDSGPDKDRGDILYPGMQPQVDGIDVSHWQGTIDWASVYGGGYRFAFTKASEGTSYVDPTFTTNMDGGHNAGMLMGAYHFARPESGNSATDEANHFLSVVAPYFTDSYLLPVLDLETGSGLGSTQLSNWVHEWMGTVKNYIKSKLGLDMEPIIYVNSNYANNYLEQSVTQYHLWIAHWTYDPSQSPNTGIWSDWNFWQYSDQGSVPGISGNTDLDVFNGDLNDLRQNYTFENQTSSIELSLNQGWNLISNPFCPKDSDLGVVLSSISGNYDIVRWYDTSDNVSHWKCFSTLKPLYLNTLLSINNTMGFWLNVTTPCQLKMTGRIHQSTAIPLLAGWNLVGYPSNNTTATIGQLFATAPSGYRAQCFNGTAKYLLREMSPSETMSPGSGYWIYVPLDWMWNVKW